MATATTDMKCLECDAAMVRDVRVQVLRYRGQHHDIDQAGWFCTADPSHDAVLDPDAELAYQTAADAFCARIDAASPIPAGVPRCPDCAEGMARETRRATWTYKGRTLEFAQPGWYCTANPAHDVVLDEADSTVTAPILLAHRAAVEGLPGPAEVRRIRQKLGLSQRQAGELLGGGIRAFHKYEKGEQQVTKAVAVLLGLLDRHPDLVAELRGRDDRAA